MHTRMHTTRLEEREREREEKEREERMECTSKQWLDICRSAMHEKYKNLRNSDAILNFFCASRCCCAIVLNA